MINFIIILFIFDDFTRKIGRELEMFLDRRHAGNWKYFDLTISFE